MGRGFELSVAFRYFRLRGRELYLSLIAWISVAGVAVGVMALIVVLSVMAGFEADLREKILGANPHVTILPEKGEGLADAEGAAAVARKTPGVVGAAPFVERKMILASGESVQGVVFRGAETGGAATGLADLDRALAALAGEAPDALIVGAEMARNLGLLKGDRVRLLSPESVATPAGPVPRVRSYRVAGVFETGMYEYDTSRVYAKAAEAADFLRLGEERSGVDVRLADPFDAPRVAALLREALGPGRLVRDWTEMNRSLFGALKLEKLAMFLFLGLAMVVAAFNIASTLVMVVMHRTRDIGVLESLGADRGAILRIFLLKGGVIGAAGTLIGGILGVGGCLFVRNSQFIRLPEDVYYIQTLPVAMDPLTIATVMVSGAALSLLAALYPAWRASRLDPVRALRHE